MSGKRLLIAPAAEPISLTEAKVHLRVDGTDEDSLITALIAAVRADVERDTGRVLIRQTWEHFLDEFPDEAIVLSVAPLRAVTSITYADIDAVSQTVAAAEYVVNKYTTLGEIHLAYGEQWPQTYDEVNAVTVKYTAGYAAPITADATTDTLTSAGHDRSDGDTVVFTNTGGALPGGLSAGTTYYVITSATDTFQVSTTSGGSAVDITSAGTGAHFAGEVPEPLRHAMKLMLAHLYENREAVNVGNIVNVMPLAVDRLLAPYRVMRF